MISPGQTYRVPSIDNGLFGRDDTVQIIRVERGIVDYIMRGIESRCTVESMQEQINSGDLVLT